MTATTETLPTTPPSSIATGVDNLVYGDWKLVEIVSNNLVKAESFGREWYIKARDNFTETISKHSPFNETKIEPKEMALSFSVDVPSIALLTGGTASLAKGLYDLSQNDKHKKRAWCFVIGGTTGLAVGLFRSIVLVPK